MPIPQASIAPGMVPEDVLPVLWRQAAIPYFDALPVAKPRPKAPIHAMHQFLLEKAIFIDATFPGQTFTRDPQWMHRHDDADHLLLQIFLAGENKVVNGRTEYRERAGNVFAVNLAHRVQAQSVASRVYTLVLPRGLVMDEIPQLTEASGAIFAPDSAGARIFADYMIALRPTLAEAKAADVPAILASMLGLLDSFTRHDDAAAAPALDAAFRSACRYIDRHLADPALDVDTICAHLNCSRDTLYRLFKAQGGVRQHIQRRRLVACFKAIGAAKHRHRRIFDIAYDWGFTSPSHFSHLFRLHFGMTPRAARELSLHEAPAGAPETVANAAGQDEVERMLRWAKSLGGKAAA